MRLFLFGSVIHRMARDVHKGGRVRNRWIEERVPVLSGLSSKYSQSK